ncbi:RNA-directed DNA polymerase, eukaryota [Tanacetum coccineum]
MEDTVPADVYSSPVGSKPIHGSHKGGSLLEVLDGMIKAWDPRLKRNGSGRDFNEVRFERERLGSVFNVHGANEFNSFISNAGACLEISDGALCLDKNLSDHRPILLREMVTDYGATPFRLYHSWFSFHGFDDMVRTAWNSFVQELTEMMREADANGDGVISFNEFTAILGKSASEFLRVTAA